MWNSIQEKVLSMSALLTFSEYLHKEVKTHQPFFAAQSVMSSTGVLCNFVFAFCMGKFASNIQTAINKSGLYFLAAGINIFGLIFCMIFVPETKGKTEEDMKAYFSGSGRR